MKRGNIHAQLMMTIGVLAIAGCAHKPNAVQVQANAMIGKPVSAAYQAFGQPYSAARPMPYGTAGGSYMWDRTKITRNADQVFVQTGTEYLGQQQVGTTGGSHGIAAMPVYQDITRPTGYYEMQDRLDYLCTIMISTDQQDVINRADVIGCD